MSTTSPNFGLIIATTSDAVNVTSHIANNFSTLDSVISIVHTGTGQLKSGLVLTNPTLSGASVLSGTLSGGTIVSTTGSFQTVTATGGTLTVNTLNVGTYNIVGTIGASGDVLTVVTGNARFVAQAPGTGANAALSNLTTVAINTNMNTFTGGFVTVARLITTSGALTGLTTFQAATGTFAGNLAVTGTITANVINVTGGAITAGSLAIGTYALPTTIGSTGQILTVTTGNAVFLTPNLAQTTAYFRAYNTSAAINIGTLSTQGVILPFDTKLFDIGSGYSTAANTYTITASGYYQFGMSVYIAASVGTGCYVVGLSGSGGPHIAGGDVRGGSSGFIVSGVVVVSAGSGNVYTPMLYVTVATTGSAGGPAAGIFHTGTFYSHFWGMKIPDA